jgi:hypothetical protein
MADIKTKYASAANITITLASLANDAKRQSTKISNTANLYLDALVQLKVKTGSSVSGDKAVYVYAYGTTESSMGYSGDASGTDGAYNGAIDNTKLIGVISTPAAGTAYVSDVMSIANAFGGKLPSEWGIIIQNKTGAALDGTESNYEKKYAGVLVQTV